MRVSCLDEPSLLFGGSHPHVDTRFGLANYGPYDADQPTAPSTIHVGVVGSSETTKRVVGWLQKCKDGLPAKESNQPNLFPAFSGFMLDSTWSAELVLDSKFHETITQREIASLKEQTGHDGFVMAAADLFVDKIRLVCDRGGVAVVVCALPVELVDRLLGQPQPHDEDDEEVEKPQRSRTNFHDLLKARAMALRIPIQLVLPDTYGLKSVVSERRSLQDEATRAWNFHTALYYKAGGIPWRIARERDALTVSYVGIGFYETLDESRLLASVAQVFDERGEGIVVRGGEAYRDKDDRTVHLPREEAAKLVKTTLDHYRAEHRTYPARVVIHKTSTYKEDELLGFQDGLQQLGIDSHDLLAVGDSFTRLFRRGQYPALRGTFWETADDRALLYTGGSVCFYQTYPGLYVPKPIELRSAAREQTMGFLAQEILQLTKMNWNNAQMDGHNPITIRAARTVGAILKYVEPESPIHPRYAYYM